MKPIKEMTKMQLAKRIHTLRPRVKVSLSMRIRKAQLQDALRSISKRKKRK